MTDFGRDTLCLDSLRPGRYATGWRLLAQRCYHRLITPRGSLRGGEDEANFGLDLGELLGDADSPALRASIPGRIANELQKDPEVDTVDVTVDVLTVAPGELRWTITISVTSALGPFDLVLAVSGVTVELVGLREAA